MGCLVMILAFAMIYEGAGQNNLYLLIGGCALGMMGAIVYLADTRKEK